MVIDGKKVQLGGLVTILLLSALLVSIIIPFQTVSAAPVHRDAPLHWSAMVGAENQDRAIQGMVFLPSVLWVNVGDDIVWTAKAGEIHTVTFLPPGQQPPPFKENDPRQIKQVGGNTYDGKHYFNSGILSNSPNSGFQASKTYSLTFSTGGDFIYYCLVHPSMIGIVHVRPAGTPYPFSQQAYNQQAQAYTQAIMSDGQKLAGLTKPISNAHQVVAGIGDGLVGVMRFYTASVKIRVGEKVTFTNHDVMVPHTITFGLQQKDIFHPYGDPKHFDGTKPLNSGYIGALPAWSGTTFTVTFTKEGTFKYICVLHGYLAMTGEVVVVK